MRLCPWSPGGPLMVERAQDLLGPFPQALAWMPRKIRFRRPSPETWTAQPGKASSPLQGSPQPEPGARGTGNLRATARTSTDRRRPSAAEDQQTARGT